MRVMQSSWGPAVMIAGGVLLVILVLSVIATFFSLAAFLWRRSKQLGSVRT